MNLTVNDVTITLKEITDLLATEHNKAVKKVEKLAEEPTFGTLEKIATVYNAKGQTIDTFLLTKKQAIAVAARLDNSMLMTVINRLEELEKKQSKSSLVELSKQKEILLALNNAQQATMEVVQEHEDRIIELEKNRRLEAWQERKLQDIKNRKVYELAKEDKDFANKLHRIIWSLFKKRYSLPRYNELPAAKFSDGANYLNNLTIADMVA